MKQKKDAPECGKCQIAMKRVSTGSMVITYQCPVCKQIRIVKRFQEETKA